MFSNMFSRGQIICAFMCFLQGGFLKTSGLFSQAEKCGGLFEADKGEIQIELSKFNCLWIIKLPSKTGVSLELKEFTTEAITVILPAQKHSQANFQTSWMIGPEATYTFEGKIFVILASPRNQKVSLSWTGLTADNSVVTLNAKFESSLEGVLALKRKFVHVDQIIWAVEPEGIGEFKWEMALDLSYCEQDRTCECMSFGVIYVTPDGRISNIHNSCEGSSVGSWEVEKGSLVVLLMFMDSSLGEVYQLQVAWECELEPLRKNVTGIAVGTEGGIYMASLNATKKTQLSSKWVSGLEFDWNSEKIYWVEKDVGIMRANVDGSDFELLIADPLAIGLGMESITGNFYYFSQSRNALRVCNNDGKKCSSIIELSGIVWNIALHSSKGILLWSTTDKEIFLATLDGSYVKQILWGKSLAIDVDEYEDRLYTICQISHEIRSYHAREQSERTVKIESIYNPGDLAVDDDKIYHSCWTSKMLCSIGKDGTSSTLIADFTNSITFFVLYGKRLSTPMSNPCEKVKCSHLCVLITASAYRCVCPDGESLQADGVSCGI